MRRDEEAPLLRDAASALGGRETLVLAVSGGLDSMVLMHLAASVRDKQKKSLVVATFDHRSGTHSAAAVRFVQKQAAHAGLRCIPGRAVEVGRREHEWREERWNFLRSVANKSAARVVTAHTLDDQVETVFMRILRDAGPRGLAGLFAESEVVRPFLTARRSELAA
ncbi:MAG: tRNA lysidine(34) synthetase TilS, partial [Thermoanaerobaculia bacterium]